ncbi:hypothetical protein AKJ52_00740 [candidate division MSBL1 archaeon SCGC-AAA382C18]|uniref:DUF2283 domain-containing protein n=1 Tax=candidate division MSBL1 archaeon SCGC-AAA382C18 TaxID=1698281 RepID=A0A133VL87_9EURY|nr:hypothetical protein AKJ52_00740 [candidate division MSBL1 archaeon SCGC-AAA382C18]
MEISYDPEVNALNIQLQKGNYEESKEFDDGIIIDYSTDGKIMNIEILDATEKISTKTIENIKKQKSIA